jgi:hypothetical protein
MRVLHIVPSAFNYFDDIRTLVFAVVDELDQVQGIDQNIFTLEYGPPSKQHKEVLHQVTPGRSYQGARSIEALCTSFVEYDIVHIHSPFLGAAKKLVAARKQHPPLILSYYRDVELVDLLSYFIRWYNRVYIPQLAAISSAVTSCSPHLFSGLQKVLQKKEIPFVKFANFLPDFKPLTYSPSSVQLLKEVPFLAKQFLILYNSLI